MWGGGGGGWGRQHLPAPAAVRHSDTAQPGWDGAKRRGGSGQQQEWQGQQGRCWHALWRWGRQHRLMAGWVMFVVDSEMRDNVKSERWEQCPGRVNGEATHCSIIKSMMSFNAEITFSPKISPPSLCPTMPPHSLCLPNADHRHGFVVAAANPHYPANALCHPSEHDINVCDVWLCGEEGPSGWQGLHRHANSIASLKHIKHVWAVILTPLST